MRHRFSSVALLIFASSLTLAFYFAGARWIERRIPVELGFRSAPSPLSIGLVLGVVLFTVLMGILWLARAYTPAGLGQWRQLGAGFLIALSAAVFEEICFRGFLFRITAILGGKWVALVVTSAMFGLAHHANPQATATSSVAIALEAGVLLGAAYAASGSLWLPIGIHAGWNFAEGPVFGMAVSGNTQAAGLIAGRLQGPASLTGGEFGPEASVVAVLVCLALASVYMVRMAKQRPRGDSMNA